MYDVIIIGAGVSGSAIARELSRYQGKFCVLEKEADICCGTSKANSGIVHAGFDAKEGSLMAKLNVEGNKMMEKLSKELDFPYQNNGSLVVCTNEEDMEILEELLKRGRNNQVEGLQILKREALLKMEPNLSDEVIAALYAPTGGIVCPFGLNIALAENATQNGVEFYLEQEVKKIEKRVAGGYRICTQDTAYETKVIVNAAGVYADHFHDMVSEKKIHITPRKGEYVLLACQSYRVYRTGEIRKRSPCDTDCPWKSSGGSYGSGYRRQRGNGYDHAGNRRNQKKSSAQCERYSVSASDHRICRASCT